MSEETIKMDDVPDELVVKGVKGKRFRSARYYSGIDTMFVLDVTYRFSLEELHKVDAAKYYVNQDKDDEVQSSRDEKNE